MIDGSGNICSTPSFPACCTGTGVPAIVTDSGGPRFIVREGETGFVAANQDEFAERIIRLRHNADLLQQMRAAARKQAEAASWDGIFDHVYRVYEIALHRGAASVSGMTCAGIAPVR